MRLFLICIFSICLFGCEKLSQSLLLEKKIITQGSFRGIEIGSSREAVLNNITLLGAYAVKPIPNVKFEIKGSDLSGIEYFQAITAIRITNHRGLVVDLYFDGGMVNKIRLSVPAKGNKWFKEGLPVNEVKTILVNLLKNDKHLVAFPIVLYEGNGWVILSEKPEQAASTLKNYDAWMFELAQDKPAGSFFELYFAEGKLARVEYRRPRIRLD